MTVMTARGSDTAEAMEQILRRLGADAFILSTTQKNGFVEITASSEMPAQQQSLSEPVQITSRSGETMSQRAQSFADLLEARSDWAPTPRPRPVVPARNTPWSRISPKAIQEAFVDRLEAELLSPDALPASQLMPRTVIVGPPGAGKSMLAARLAAAVMQAIPGVRPKIIAPRTCSLLSDDKLTGWLRLLGLKPERPLIGDLLQADKSAQADATRPEIIDLSDISMSSPDLAAVLAIPVPTEIVLALPSGLSARRTAQICTGWSAMSSRVCLTFTDQSLPEKAQLQALLDAGLRLSRAAAGTGIAKAISVPDRTDLARWLQDEANESGNDRAEARG